VRVDDQVASDGELARRWRAALVVQDLWMPPRPETGLVRDVLGSPAVTTDQP
jgi:hypothetical protein